MNSPSVRLLQPDTVIAQRYAVETLLGRGGMAVVYRVRDLTNQRVVALKRLSGHHEDNDPIARLFEREFCTLSQLVHPRIIEVYDYQTDAEGAFYTMELLSGGDLRQRAPIAWQEACRLLCDVCSALSLLHSRRFVHRDLTPLNVRCTADGRAKLIDFGSMAQFGRSKHVVGTPPFVAPESLSGQVIDGKTDLYALGATAYYALTGVHAYPARSLAELPELWQCAALPPSHHVPGIPEALDELVLELLSPAQLGRPSNAAEVLERLSAVAGFELEEALRIRDAYVSTPTLVGRADALASLDQPLRRALDGHGGALLVTGARGTGRSRFLDACRLQGKLRGALVLSASAEERVPWAAASALLEQLRTQAPELSAELVTLAASSIARSASTPPPLPEARASLQVLLRETFLSIASRRALLLAVDDIDRVDEPSAALFALLAHHASHARLLIVATADKASRAAPPKPLELLADLAEQIALGDLQERDTQALVSSVFGPVANVRLLADRIHAASSGNPGLVMHLCQHMVACGRVQYAAGQWTLPSKIDVDELSSASRDRLDENLSPRALELARALALAGAASRSFDDCLRLSGHRERKRLHADLHALCAAGVLSMEADSYRVSGPSWEALLLRDLDPELERTLHARLAEFRADQPGEVFRVVQHLLQAGEPARALDLWLSDAQAHRASRTRDPITTSVYLQLLPKNWQETFHALIAACQELGRPLVDRLTLQMALLAYATLSARSEPATVRAVAEQLAHDAGLDVYEALGGDALPHELRLQRALSTAQRRYEATPLAARGLPLNEAITELARTILQANGLVGRTLDYGLLASLPSLRPYSQLSPALEIVQKTVDSTLHILAGRLDSALDGYRNVVIRLEQPGGIADLDEVHRAAMHPAVLFAMGSIEAHTGRPNALRLAAALHETPWFAVSALRLETLHALFQGDLARAERCRADTELFEIQNQPPQLLEGTHLMQWMFGCALLHDLAGVKQCSAEIDALANDYEAWKPLAHCARGLYQALRGDHARALPEYETAMQLMAPGRHTAWVMCAGAHVNALLRLARLEETLERGCQYLEIARREQFGRTECELLLPLAEAKSLLGQHDQAIEHIDTAISALSHDGGCGARLGEAYEVRAWIALRLGDVARLREYAAASAAQYRIGSHPFLLARHDKLLQAARKAGLLAPLTAADARDSSIPRGPCDSQMSTVLNKARSPEQRAQHGLERLLRQSRSTAGWLYIVKDQRPVRMAQLGTLPCDFDVDARVSSYLLDQSNWLEMTDTKSATNPPEVAWFAPESAELPLVPVLLSHPTPQGRALTGVAVLQPAPGAALRTPVRLLQALSRAFHEAGEGVQTRTAPLGDAS
jgi:predicted transcriptional regulator